MEVQTLIGPPRHWLVDGLVPEALLTFALAHLPPADWPHWVCYDNSYEGKKRATNDMTLLGIGSLLAFLNAPDTAARLARITGIAGLQADESCWGGGIHVSEPGDRLQSHLDYSLHPKTGLERRLNLILYLAPRWQEEWGGATEFYGEDGQTVTARVVPSWGRCLLFEPSEEPGGPLAYHGTQEVSCPAGVERVTAACYYLAEPRPGASRRYRALYVPRR